MKNFVIADLRFFDDEQRKKMGYSNFEQMNRDIIKSWNKVVKENDIVNIMGDLGQGSFEQMQSVISKLNGKLCWSSRNLQKFNKDQWKEIGLQYIWDVSMFDELDDGRIILYCITPIRNEEIYKHEYCLLVVDHNNYFEGMTKGIMLSADAAKWYYSPLDCDDLMNIYNNMREFEQMENEEHRTEIKEVGE